MLRSFKKKGFINHASTLYPTDICSDEPNNELEILKKNPISSLTRTCSRVVTIGP